MRILFIDPGFGKRSWHTFGQSHWTSIIHAGICGLSACLKENGYSDIHLLDLRALRGWEDMEHAFTKIGPDLACLTMRSCDIDMDAQIARRIKKTSPKTKIVVGGVHCSIDPEGVAENQDYDFIIAGEGEISLVKLVEAIQRGSPFPRLSWGERPNLDELPFIDRELYPYKVSINLQNYEGVFRAPMVTMLCSRGCYYNCSFCAPHARVHFGRGVRFRSVQNVMKELELLYDRYAFECVKFYDYTFTQKADWVEEFCREYRRINKPFWIQSRADLVCNQERLIEMLAEVGLKMVGIGFESGSDKVLKDLRKGATREINLKAAEIVKKNGVLLSASFMLGVPTEEEEDVKATISLAKQMTPDFTSVSFFTPIPGNDLYDYCKKQGLILNEDPEMYVEFSPEIPKIKGKDYEKLKLAAEEIMGDRFGGKLIGKVIRFFYVKTKYHYRLRRILVFIYSRWVSGIFYHMMQRKRVPIARFTE
jgi:anaerobic magnesium-protoporphyrin IX monomethyl ester cyclase